VYFCCEIVLVLFLFGIYFFLLCVSAVETRRCAFLLWNVSFTFTFTFTFWYFWFSVSVFLCSVDFFAVSLTLSLFFAHFRILKNKIQRKLHKTKHQNKNSLTVEFFFSPNGFFANSCQWRKSPYWYERRRRRRRRRRRSGQGCVVKRG